MHLPDLLELAGQSARAAGALLRDSSPHLRAVTASDARDVKLEADQASERLLRERLGPPTGFPCLGEELGGDPGLTERYEPYWVIDPLDGTYNYLRGVPLCCVSIGLMRGRTPVLGAIYDFNRDELFTGVVAGGFFRNGQPHRSEWAARPDQACLQTGFPAGRDYSTAGLQAFIGRTQDYQKIRATGSAALALAWVAAGWFDAYFEEGIRLWDVAAGLALVQAAGGVIRMSPTSGDKPLAYDVWAAGRPELILG